MPTLLHLNASFRRAIAAALAASPALGACGEEPGIEGDPDFVPVPCSGDSPAWLGDLKPAPPVDFLQLVGDVAQQDGEACQGATNLAACLAALAALPQPQDPQKNCQVGRRPAGLHEVRRARCHSAGEYLARAASLEAASVIAFRHLARELTAHGAEVDLVAAARAAARDEVRHARTTARLAARLGATPQLPCIAAMPVRDLETIALENAREGCVRETFGALEGRWQSLHAQDPELRRAYRRIAQDELRHAALAWSVAHWMDRRLTRPAQQRVQAARRAALVQLQRELRDESRAEIRRVCGVPNRREAQVLFDALAPTLA